jgi:hypothetical protein
MSIAAVNTRPAASANGQPLPDKSTTPSSVGIPAELQALFTFTIDLNSPYIDYLLGQSLLNKPEPVRQAIAAALIEKSGLKSLDLALPPGKLYLAPARDTAMGKLLFPKEKKPWNLQELIVVCYSALQKGLSSKAITPAEGPAPLFVFSRPNVLPLLATRDVPLTVVPADPEAKSVEVLVGRGAAAVRFILTAESQSAEAKALYLLLVKKQQELGLPPLKQVNMTDPGLNPIVRFAPADSGPLDVVFDNCSSEELLNWTEDGWQKAAQAIKMTVSLNAYADHGLWRLVLLDSFLVQDRKNAPLSAHRMINYAGIPPTLIVDSDSYLDTLDAMQISLKHDLTHVDHIVAHEMSHLLYGQWVRNDQALTEQFRQLFAIALGENRFELADDSNYLPVYDFIGHPFDDPGELFASFGAAYLTKPEQLSAFINDHSTPELTKRLGIALWCLLRERIFQGRVFSYSDPFRNFKFDSVITSFTAEEVKLSLWQAKHSKNMFVAAAAGNDRFYPVSVLPADR